ncbi:MULTISPECIES: phage major capsid protein [Lentilactobacillus]|uniref:Phage prohead protease, HK97 family n=1 Tax=Lentilactobacillus kisonensis F0435 TaxID=797516 RepID=H1LBW8_9LACO|nr:phage major capsid protein [Lentilactobacillus kisonensis]EHO54518.1 phage prohead protease, HK97 family [Lentilactobacillus kisonensis F0435]
MQNKQHFTLTAQLKAEQRDAIPDEPENPEDNKQPTTATQVDGKPTISGYAVVFNSPSLKMSTDDGTDFVELIDPKALDGLDLSKLVLLNSHNWAQPLARADNGTLTTEIDDVGLKFTAELDPSVSYAMDTFNNIKNGVIGGCSFTFDLDNFGDSWTQDTATGQITRTINHIDDLYELTTTAIPSYGQTSVQQVIQVESRSYEQFIENSKEKKDNKMTEKKIIDPNDPEKNHTTEKPKTEVRSFEDYIRSHGEMRDGVTTQGASAVIPKELITPVFQLKTSRYNLAQYATVKQVSSGSGTYPIATSQQTAVLATKDELAQMADINANMFTNVPFDVKTRAGQIALSNEVVEDSEVDIVSEVKNQLQQLVDNTDNTQIMSLLTGTSFTKATAANIDDLKKIFNVTLDPALSKMWLVNQSGFNYLDTLKDSDGRYLLQPNPTAPSGFTLLGAPVVMISDKLLANNVDGTSPMIAGDLSQAVAVFRRNQVTAQWDKFDQFSQGLSVIVRNDYKVIDKTAAINVALKTTPGK